VVTFIEVFCLGTGPYPFPKRVLCTLRSSASSFSSFIILSFSQCHTVAAYVFFLVLSLILSSLQQRVLEGSSFARCVQSSNPAFVLLCARRCFLPPGLCVGLIFLNISRDRSNWSEFFSCVTFHNTQGHCTTWRHTQFCLPRFSSVLISTTEQESSNKIFGPPRSSYVKRKESFSYQTKFKVSVDLLSNGSVFILYKFAYRRVGDTDAGNVDVFKYGWPVTE
jgi:hypothetical protein